MDLNQTVTDLNARKAISLPIVQFPHEALRQVSRPIIDDIKTNTELKRLLDDMVETMIQMHGVGLAAIQVGYALRCLVLMDETGKIYKVINPSLKQVSKETETAKEGCLSFLGLAVNVKRSATCVVEYFDEDGDLQTINGSGLLGRAIQHEVDHLDGRTFLDRISNVEKRMALNRNKQMKRRIKAAKNTVQAR